jgi:CheY-like chemotaxis protein
MPEMGGIEATERIRAEAEHQPIIIALTANAFAENRERCLKSGMNDVITKPLYRPLLVDILDRYCNETVVP